MKPNAHRSVVSWLALQPCRRKRGGGGSAVHKERLAQVTAPRYSMMGTRTTRSLGQLLRRLSGLLRAKHMPLCTIPLLHSADQAPSRPVQAQMLLRPSHALLRNLFCFKMWVSCRMPCAGWCALGFTSGQHPARPQMASKELVE
eukprot:1372941-Amphidinium_carterae.2